MAPDDVSEILRAVYDVDKRVALVDLALTEHIRVQGTDLSLHIATCPSHTLITELTNNVNALAGIQRSDHADVIVLKAWHASLLQASAVESATETLKQTPIKWALTNIDKLFWVLLAAFLIYRFGF